MNLALLGNPNTGKTSLFNNLTGSYEYVGNWSGVTVEKKIGTLKNKAGQLIDLPGIYTLNPLSKDEGVVSNFFIHDSFDGIVNIVDASQLERNLNLTIQLLEFGKPLVIGLNMNDVAKNRGIYVDEQKLSTALHVPVTSIIARTGKGCSLLRDQLANLQTIEQQPLILHYGAALEKGIEALSKLMPKQAANHFPHRWLALQFFESNQNVQDFLAAFISTETLKALYEETEQAVQKGHGVNSLSQWIYTVRRTYIDSIIEQAVDRQSAHSTNWTDRIDAVVTNKVLGLPIFLLCMLLLFKLTFDWLGTPLSDALDSFFSGPLTNWLSWILTSIGASSFIQALVLNGIISGVGGVLVFMPQIFILFFFISLLEDSGYMARVALVMDKVMESVGLNGKAFIPMIIGFGCNVPGIMAARTIEQPKERLLTILLTPLMSCSARLPVYALFVGAFFVQYQTIIVFSLYLLGIVMALLLAKLFSMTILKEEQSLFVIELPPYRLPQSKALFRSTWDKGKGFIRKAGTFIFGGSVIIWLLTYAGPHGLNVQMDDSFLALVGGFAAPLLAPLGFGTWQAGAALITGFLAKEVVVSSMNIIYHVPNVDSLQGLMATQFTPLAAFTFMVFVLLYIPCLATVGTIRKETGSAKWTYFSIIYALVLAYVLSFVIYQGGKLLGF
ncbi:ferrous iron transport protein B [Bacillus wudalianchiensis]|uniref:Ferrous iron transport protein B n=2 Tax=Pseudobacillus wudalianchiensis TaxID=1743143 RepID=A0A1B9AMS1_9BACI|nr:ferrous iron transport protein B [Bacillus wudalianchiensis]OCA85085.1 ferrous iron transport protein B [Bacillus wudalianchiensis]